jgi:ABC-type transport system involved in multi-copper enzyme maturation permease subunit
MAEPATLPSERGRASPQRSHFSLFGPLFYYDLVRQARRGRVTLLRCAYALLLFVALRYTFVDRFPFRDIANEFQPLSAKASVKELNSLGLRFVHSILRFQTAAVFFVTPAYVSGTFVAERKRKTFDALLTAHLSDLEVVSSSLASRVAQLYCLLLTGLPVMALTLLWGGVDYRILPATVLITALNVVTLAAFSIWCSVGAKTMSMALVGSYALSAFTYVVCSSMSMTPIGIYQWLSEPGPNRSSYPTLEAAILLTVVAVVASCRYAAIALRPSAGVRTDPWIRDLRAESRLAPVSEVARRSYYGVRSDFQRANSWPPVGDWPLLWREIYSPFRRSDAEFEPLDREGCHIAFLILAGLAVIGCGVLSPVMDPSVGEPPIRSLICMAAVTLYCVVTFRAAAGVSVEREGQTLEALLSLPVSREEILGAKWLGPILHFRLYGYLLGLPLAMGIASGTLHPLAALFVVIAVAAHLSFLVSIGLFLSVICSTTVQARVVSGVVLFVFSTGALHDLAYSWGDLLVDPMFSARLVYSSFGTAVCALAAAAFWLVACWRFRQTTEH